MPGRYTVVLTVSGQTYTQPLAVRMDPTVKIAPTALAKQFELSQRMYKSLLTLSPAAEESAAMEKQIGELKKQAKEETLAAVNALEQKLRGVRGRRTGRPGPPEEAPSGGGIKTRMLALLTILQEPDAAPTARAVAAVSELEQGVAPLMQRWESIKKEDVPALNTQLQKAALPELK